MRLPKIVVKDASSLAKQVTWLNFEPRSQNFLVKVATFVPTFTHTTIGSLFYLMCIYERVLEIRLPKIEV